MELIKKNVIIQLHTVIDDDGDKESSYSKHKGIFYKKNDLEVIKYTDSSNDFGEIKSIITLHPKKLSVKRSGAVSMQQLFTAGKKSECVYRHPYGQMFMEIVTRSVKVDRMPDCTGGKAVVEYDMLFEERNRHYQLTLEYMEED